VSGRSLLTLSLGPVYLFAGCGGSSIRSAPLKIGSHVVVQPIKGDQLLGGIVLRAPGEKRPETAAERRKLIEEFAAWTWAHCPCDFEQTATGPRVVRERHP
jgi:hypothetical protein